LQRKDRREKKFSESNKDCFASDQSNLWDEKKKKKKGGRESKSRLFLATRTGLIFRRFFADYCQRRSTQDFLNHMNQISEDRAGEKTVSISK